MGNSTGFYMVVHAHEMDDEPEWSGPFDLLSDALSHAETKGVDAEVYLCKRAGLSSVSH